jgi:hypothetical protein
MRLKNIEFKQYYTPILTMNNLKYTLVFFLITMSFSINAQEKKAELPESFLGEWVEDLAQCEVFPILRIIDSDEGLVVASLDWSSTEVMVTNKGDFYTLQIKGSSEEGDFETEINVKMADDGGLIYSFPDLEEIKLVKCNLDGDVQYMEVEMDIEVEMEIDEMELVDTVLAVEEFEMVELVDSDSITLELLQGKWQSLEDEDSFMVIEGDRMKNYYGGMDEELDNEAIMLADTCMNESDSENGLPEEKNRYLSNPNLDMCWYIDSVDATSLSLIYMATGNMLTYKKVE